MTIKRIYFRINFELNPLLPIPGQNIIFSDLEAGLVSEQLKTNPAPIYDY
jgi:hypothetical protein